MGENISNKIALRPNLDSNIHCLELLAITSIEFMPKGYTKLVEKILKVCVRAENLE